MRICIKNWDAQVTQRHIIYEKIQYFNFFENDKYVTFIESIQMYFQLFRKTILSKT